MRLLMDNHAFSYEEAQNALTPDPLIPRPGANKDKSPAIKPSRGDTTGKAQLSPLSNVKTTHRRPAPGSWYHRPHPRTCPPLEDQHQSSPRTQQQLLGKFVATTRNVPAGKTTHPVLFPSPEPASSKTIETVSSDCGSCGGGCVYSVPSQNLTGIESKTSRGDKVAGHTGTELAEAKAKRDGYKTSGKLTARTAKIDLDMPVTIATSTETGINGTLPTSASIIVKMLEDPILSRSKRGRTVANHFPASPDAYRQHAPGPVTYTSVLDPGPANLDTTSQPLRNTPSKTGTLPPTINTGPAEDSQAQLRKPRRGTNPTRSTGSSLAKAGSQNSEQSKPGSVPAFADEAISQAASTRKKEVIIKVMQLGVEWDVVDKDEAGEDDWLAVDVDETTAKIEFMKIAAEKL